VTTWVVSDTGGWVALGSSGLPASGVTPGTYGDSTHVGQFTVNLAGQVTAASNVAISGGGGGGSGFTLVARTTFTSSVSTSGTTFATGANLLPSSLAFTGDGTTDYFVQLFARQWSNTGASGTHNRMSVNYDSADAGIVADYAFAGSGFSGSLVASAVLAAPTAAAHTVNFRLFVSAGTGTVSVGAGGAGQSMPGVALLYKFA